LKKFDIPKQFHSSVIAEIKEKRKNADRMKKDFSPSLLEFEKVEFVLARHFGFCFGVENAVEKVYQILNENPKKNIFLLSQMIHNPTVNKDLESRGIRFIMNTSGVQLIPWQEITSDDIVIIPAFGTTLLTEKILEKKGIKIENYNTTCPFVEKVWNRSSKLGGEDYTIIIHGKVNHEETRATFSHSNSHGKTIIVKNLDEAKILARFMDKTISKEEFEQIFKGKFSEGFDPDEDLKRIGVVNQTTMLASETHEISDFFKNKMISIYGQETIKNHFADTKDTLCYATNDNQKATLELMKETGDFAVVVGGYNSSNTMHLVELLEEKIKTFFVQSADKIIGQNCIKHFNLKTDKEIVSEFFPNLEGRKLRVLLTCGASCPDSVLNEVIGKIVEISKN